MHFRRNTNGSLCWYSYKVVKQMSIHSFKDMKTEYSFRGFINGMRQFSSTKFRQQQIFIGIYHLASLYLNRRSSKIFCIKSKSIPTGSKLFPISHSYLFSIRVKMNYLLLHVAACHENEFLVTFDLISCHWRDL